MARALKANANARKPISKALSFLKLVNFALESPKRLAELDD
jgi:hypothetical protein